MGKRTAAVAAIAAILLGGSAGSAQTSSWSPQPWLEDLAQARTAIETKYANLEWLLIEREFDLAGLFARAEAAIRQGRSDADAMAVFDRLVSRINDGHVGISWRRPSAPQASASAATPAPPPTIESFCRARGFDPGRPGIGPALKGYAPLDPSDVLPAGTVPLGAGRAGIVRIGKFEPGGSPSLCPEAVAALAIPIDRPCDDACQDKLLTHTYRRLTAAFEERLTRLRAAGATTLLVDVTGNGGGSEWVQAVARMLSPRELVSQRLGFVRGSHWAGTWSRLAERLRGFARTASPQDRRRLLAWAAEADAAGAEAEKTCPPTGGCPWLGRVGYATGLVGRARAGAFAGKEWGPWIFNPAQYPYRDGVWDGPVIVLVDEGTASAAEEFAALLQDNQAAFVLGARTGGLGCGHTWGGTPTVLKNSGATLRLPDCARFRTDGTNEVRGVIPDHLLPWRTIDGSAFKARLLQAALPEAAKRAAALHASSRNRSAGR
jgi:hypothetical protein